MRTILAGALACVLAVSARAAIVPAPPGCVMAAGDAAWLDAAIGHWRIAEQRLLKLAPSPLPPIVAVDARCAYDGQPRAEGGLAWVGAPHAGTVRFPDGKAQPAGPLAFASPDTAKAGAGYFAIGLPSLWRAGGVTSVMGLERLMDGVVLHELVHTRQFYFASPRLAALDSKYRLGGAIGDDSLQTRFAGDAAYGAAYAAERDALFAAASAPDDATARTLARRALGLLRARRARFFTGPDAKWGPLDDVFLTMEGLGQWTAYAWLRAPAAGVPSGVDVLRAVRRDGRYWTQDEGLALFLTVDRLVPDWQALAFSARPALAKELLARAAGD